MKFVLIIFLFLLTACNNSNENLKETTIINSNANKDYEYASKIYIKDVLTIENGEFINPNTLLTTAKLGHNKIVIPYKNNLNQIKNYELVLNVVDTTKPIIHISNLSTIKGKSINILSKTMCGDNYDRHLKCYVEGDYNINELGEYPLKIIAIDSSSNKNEANFKLTVKEKSSDNSSSKKYYYVEDLIKEHKNNNTMIGIDVSSWQSDIDWKKVKNAGIEFAMIRMGFGQKSNGEIVFDSKFRNNLTNAKDNGIKVGLYFYSYAKTKYDALKQAKWIVNALNGEKLDLPIAFDWEIWSNFNSYGINFYDLNEIVKTFINEIENNGYKGMNYGSAFFMNRIWDTTEYDTWLAHYTKKTNYNKPYYIWQLTNQGKVPGINGYVDLNILYKK